MINAQPWPAIAVFLLIGVVAGAPTDLRLPGHQRRTRHTPGRGAHQPFALSPELTAALERLSREEGVTLFMTLLAGFQTLLRRYTGQDDICVATPVATREPETEAVVGCFMNTLVLRGDLSGDPTFRELLQRTRRVALEGFEHADVPFERVVEALGPARAADHAPLFQALLVLHNLRLPELRVAGLELRQVDIESGTAVTDLALLLDTGQTLRGVLEYNAERFDAATAPRSPLVAVQPRGSEPPLVCVHPVSGTVFCYVELARALGEDRPFYGLEAVGLRDGEEPHDRIEDMAGAYVEALRGVQPAGPYRLGGWSMGGVTAYEMACQLEAEGEHVELLAVLDAQPNPPAAGNGDAEQLALLGFARDIGLSPDQLTVPVPEFWQLHPDEQLAHVLEHARAANLVPAGVDVVSLRRQLRVFTHNLRAMRQYTPRPYPRRLTLIEAGDSRRAAPDRSTVWDQLAAGGVARHTVAGEHYTLLRQPAVGLVAERLRACLADLAPVAS